MFKLNRAIVMAGICGLLTLASQVAQAGNGRSIRVDALDEFNIFTGEYWPLSGRGGIGLDTSGHVRADGSFGLSVNTSGGPYGSSTLYLLDNNALADYLGEIPGALKIYAFGTVQRIVPFFFATPDDGVVTWQSVEWARGFVDTVAPYVESDAAKAIRFTWQGVLADNTVVDTQIVLIDRSKGGSVGDVDIELNYGRGSFGYPPGAMQLFDLGGYSAQVKLADGTAVYTLSFRDGALVPEPSTYALFTAGFIVLGLIALRRRATPERGQAR